MRSVSEKRRKMEPSTVEMPGERRNALRGYCSAGLAEGAKAAVLNQRAALRGKRVLVLGRSTIVGRPMAALLLAHDGTVTIAHSRTRDLVEECRRAEILIVAVGRPELVRGDWLAPGAVVIDVGINRVGLGEGRSRLVGDVAFAEALGRVAAITPVPGGVGPMTIAVLLRNTVVAAHRNAGLVLDESAL